MQCTHNRHAVYVLTFVVSQVTSLIQNRNGWQWTLPTDLHLSECALMCERRIGVRLWQSRCEFSSRLCPSSTSRSCRHMSVCLSATNLVGRVQAVRGRCREVKYCQPVQNLFPLPLAHWCTNTKIQNILLPVRSAGNYRCYVVDPRFSAMWQSIQCRTIRKTTG